MCAKQNEEGCVTVTWEIRNFALLLEEDVDRSLESPLWKVEHTEGSEEWWRLRAKSYSGYNIHFEFVFPEDYKFGSKREISLVFSGEEVPLDDLGILEIEKGGLLGQSDNLIVRCKIRNKTIRNREISTHSDLHGVNYLWNIEHFDAEQCYKNCIEQGSFLLYVSLTNKSIKDNAHIVTIRGQCEEKIISIVDCKMSFKDGGGHVIHQTCIPLSDKWKFYVKINTENNTNVSFELKPIVALHKVSNDTELPSLRACQVPEEIAQSSCALCDDFLLLFKEKLFCDATLTAEGQSFPAHKVVLAARSPVFRAMFEKRETSEGRSGVVAIDDVDGATLERMLVFLYGGRLGEVGWEEASTLYYAADKYDVRALKQKCAEILKGGLTADNACDALVVSDRHSDQDLMTRVVDFLFEHQEVMSSTSWEELEDSQPRLTSKITRQVLLKKGKNC